MSEPPMQVYVNGRTWRFEFVDELPEGYKTKGGFCEGPHIKGKRIQVSSKVRGQNQLEKVTHELLHAADWDKDEEWVTQVASDIARVLWRLGYRRTEQANG